MRSQLFAAADPSGREQYGKHWVENSNVKGGGYWRRNRGQAHRERTGQQRVAGIAEQGERSRMRSDLLAQQPEPKDVEAPKAKAKKADVYKNPPLPRISKHHREQVDAAITKLPKKYQKVVAEQVNFGLRAAQKYGVEVTAVQGHQPSTGRAPRKSLGTYHGGSNAITLNRSHMREVLDPEKWERHKRARQRGWEYHKERNHTTATRWSMSSITDSGKQAIQATMTHEAGHAVDHNMELKKDVSITVDGNKIEMRGGYAWGGKSGSNPSDYLWMAADELAARERPNSGEQRWMQRKVSEYGSSSEGEFFAEVFAAVETGRAEALGIPGSLVDAYRQIMEQAKHVWVAPQKAERQKAAAEKLGETPKSRRSRWQSERAQRLKEYNIKKDKAAAEGRTVRTIVKGKQEWITPEQDKAEREKKWTRVQGEVDEWKARQR